MHQSSQKGKMEWCANGSTDQPHLRMWHLLRTGQNIGQAPWAFDRMDMCAIKVYYIIIIISLASVFFLLSVSLFSPANWVLILPDSEIQTHTWHGDLFIIMTHSHDVYFSSRPNTDKVHTVQMLSKDMILASFSLIWRVKVLSYSPFWRVPWKSQFHPCFTLKVPWEECVIACELFDFDRDGDR
jgi:hypothetical protein